MLTLKSPSGILILIKRILLLLMVFSAPPEVVANEVTDSLLHRLDEVLERRDTYYVMREYRIDSLRNVASRLPSDAHIERVGALHDIWSEYASYQADSALVYAIKSLDQAHLSGDAEAILGARTDLLFTYMSAGAFTDAVELVNKVDLTSASRERKAEFYFLCIRLFSDLSLYSSDSFSDKYAKLSQAYCDSVMSLAPAGSYYYDYASIFNPRAGLSSERKRELLVRMLGDPRIDVSTKAMLSSILADFLSQAHDKNGELEYKIRSAILDIEAAKRETVSKLDLAKILFECGDIERAYRYGAVAYEDADYYNSRHRKGQSSVILSLIDKVRYMTLDSERNRLRIVTAIMVVLVLMLCGAGVYIIRQMKTLKESRREIKSQNEEIKARNATIEEANDALGNANEALAKTNATLQQTLDKYHESVKIKDEYIGYGFYLNADYIRKMESLFSMVDRKLKARQYDDLFLTLKKGDLRKEKERMTEQFDRTFLRLFPSFIEQYKRLFPADDPKNAECDGSTLTSEMRIFALIRLGITDISNIALFLNYSVNTVNTYKTKAKNRSLVPNDKFEEAIMSIKSVD